MCLHVQNNDALHHIYSDTIFNKHVFVIGPYPPPLGGVSVHIKRVMQKLREQHNVVHHINPENIYPYAFLRLFPFKYCLQVWYLIKFFFLIMYYRPDVSMYHSFCARNSIPELMIITVLKKIMRYQSLVIEHDCRHMYQRSVRWRAWFSYYLQQMDQLVCIGNTSYQSYSDNKIAFPNLVTIESSFLPPIMSESTIICATYPQELFSFLAVHKPIIIINAFQLSMWHGKDLYGIDQAIEMIKQLKQWYPHIGLVIVLSSIGDESYYQMLLQRIEQYILRDAVFIMYGQKELWPLLKHATVFIRPTLSDSYGISIAEALYLGIPAVASDVCQRPKGTYLYNVGNVEDLVIKVHTLLQKER